MDLPRTLPRARWTALQKNVGPILAEWHRNRFSLTALFKNGKIDFARYAARVTEFFEQRQFELGYAEWVL